ncbi:MAG: PBP1A family penicillin-binding protein [Clostridiaceae bacterium]|nr:PBP1A family penicillin-binding protein [Clostridiaceae bacterium]
MHKTIRDVGWFFSGTLGWITKILLTIIVIGIVTAAICTTVFALYIDRYIKPAIESVDISDLTLNYTSVVYAVNRETGEETELEQLYDENNRIWIDYDQIPAAMYHAVVAVEDNRFYTHSGVDWVRTIGAMINMVVPIRSNFGGGSTITQQMIKNLTGEDDITVERKLQEILRALEVEKSYTKEDILEMYLNVVYFGRGCYGVETAAETYFGKSASELSIAECASIAAITNSPTYYDPIRKPENNKRRQELILDLMYEQGYITEAEYKDALAEELQVQSLAAVNAETKPKQSYYVDQVINDVLADLQSELGYSETAASNLLFSGGLSIYACIDPDIQTIVDEVYRDTENLPHTTDVSQPQSAMVVMDPYTGDVVAMAGGVGEKTVDRAWNRATMTKRSPGSTIKPLTVYAPAIEYGIVTPATVFDDSPVNEETMYPKNTTPGYTGRMTVKKAMQLSTNTVAMKVLELVTPERSFDFGTVNLSLDLVRSVTIGGKVYSDVNYSPLSMGGTTYGLTVLEMTAAYGSFVNHGIFSEARTYTKVLDSKGNVLLNNETEAHVAMKEKTAYYMNNLLRNVVEAGTGTLAKISGIAVAGKTGTTTEDYDRWFVGYTPNYVAGVWYGYDNGRELKMETNKNPAVEIWSRVMTKVMEGIAYEPFFQLETVQAQYCIDSGYLPSQYCSLDPRGSRVTTGTFLREDVPTKVCESHVPVKMCAESGLRAGEYCPQESLVTISLLKLDRTGRVTMTDDAYMYREATAYAEGTIQNPYSTLCTLHTAPTEPDVTEPDVTEPNPVEGWLFDPTYPNEVIDPEDDDVPDIKPPVVQDPTDITEATGTTGASTSATDSDGGFLPEYDGGNSADNVPGWLG